MSATTVETTLYRWHSNLDLPAALATLGDAVLVAETPTERPCVGRWQRGQGQIEDVVPAGQRDGRAVGRIRRRSPAELAEAGAYAVRAFTSTLDLHWRDEQGNGHAAWLSEHPDAIELPGTDMAALRCDRTVIRRGQPISYHPVPGWSAWGDAEVGVIWYPIDRNPPGTPDEPVPVLRVADYATEVTDGPAAGCVAPRASRWYSWEMVSFEELVCPHPQHSARGEGRPRTPGTQTRVNST